MGTKRSAKQLTRIGILLVVSWFWVHPRIQAQDDLLDLLGDTEEPTTEYAFATFKATKIINTQSVENPSEGVLQFLIQHRFGTINQGAYELFGIDQSTIRFAFDYGITDRIMIGFGRSSLEKTYDGSLKIKLLRQSKGVKNMPITLSYYGATFLNSLKWQDPTRKNLFSSRLSYVNQLLIARKFNDYVSLQLTPSMLHYNLVDFADRNNDIYSIGLGGRFKINQRLSVNADYHFLLPRRLPDDRTNSLSLGLDIETGGHVFQLHVTNSRGMFDRSFIGETTGKWSQGDIYFGFNISRVFTLYRPKHD